MEFQAIDALLPAGHGIRLVLTETGEDYLAPLVVFCAQLPLTGES